jgi:signal transduction histidine kinase
MNKALSALENIRGLRRSIVAVLVVIVAMPLISLWATFQIRELSNRITTVDEARLSLSRALRYAVDEEAGLRGYAVTDAPMFLQPYRAADPAMNVSLAQLPSDFVGAGLYDVLPELIDFGRLHQLWHVRVATPLLANPHASDRIAIEQTGKQIVDRMRGDAQRIQLKAAAYTHQQSSRMFGVMIVSGLLAVLWIVIVGGCLIVLERRAFQREMELVASLVDERESVERLSDWRSRLLAMLAHDFKSQLAVVIGAAHLLEDFPHRRGDPQLLRSVRSAGYALAEMADNAILLARAQERRLALQRSNFDMCEIIDTVVQRYGVEREFHVNCVPTAALVDGDRSYVTRVLDNIIGNAVKYSEDPVEVRVEQEERQIRVTVADRGVGIAEHELPHIFEEFWRSERALWNKKGSGVGLFIVKQIMEAHEGSIRVTSGLGEGTTVTLRFPRSFAEVAPKPAPIEDLRIAT